MRTLKELLIILRDSIKDEKYLVSGLCYEVEELIRKRKLTWEEHTTLKNFIKDNKPKRGQFGYVKKQEHYSWYWILGQVAPRVRWLNYWIAKLEKEESNKRT